MKKITIFYLLLLSSLNVFSQEINEQNNQTISKEEVQTYENNTVYDPLEPINRSIYSLNKSIDKYTLKPVATFYKDNTHVFVQQTVSNFINYLETPFYIINYGLQGNGELFRKSLARMLINTFGLGIIDFASAIELNAEPTNFGDTLGYYGVKEGPYLVLPILGGATLRDNTAKVMVDMQYSPENYSESLKNGTFTGIKLIDTRKSLLKFDSMIEENSFDEYSFVRDSTIKSKRYKIEELKSKDSD